MAGRPPAVVLLVVLRSVFGALAVLRAAELVTRLASIAVDALLLVSCVWQGTSEAFRLGGDDSLRPARGPA